MHIVGDIPGFKEAKKLIENKKDIRLNLADEDDVNYNKLQTEIQLVKWQARKDSNLQHPDLESGALPIDRPASSYNQNLLIVLRRNYNAIIIPVNEILKNNYITNLKYLKNNYFMESLHLNYKWEPIEIRKFNS